MTFPRNFYWGGATSASQCEGAYDIDGKGLSYIDIALGGSKKETRFNTYRNKNGEIVKAPFTEPIPSGCIPHIYDDLSYPNHEGIDFYHCYREDIKLFKEMGFTMFRMSIAWSRIYPNVDDAEPNAEGIRFYRDVLTELHKNGIEPLVTISHYEEPLALYTKYDGWKNRKSIDLYMKYVETIFEEYKELVKYWLPFNEINGPLMQVKMNKNAKYNADDIYRELHYKLLANAKATKLAHDKYPDFMIGCMIAGGPCNYPDTCKPEDVLSAQQDNQTTFYASDVMIRGHYPSYAYRMWESQNVNLNITDEDASILEQGKVDMYTFSYYSTGNSSTSKTKGAQGNFTFGAANPYLSYSDWGWAMDPLGLRFALNEIYSRYEIPIMVVENGLGAYDTLECDNRIHDPYRIEYIKQHLKALRDSITIDHIDVRAYTAWGCIDLVSGSTGEMAKRYGFIYVDKNDDGTGTMKRYRKDSFYWYQKVISSNGSNLD